MDLVIFFIERKNYCAIVYIIHCVYSNLKKNIVYDIIVCNKQYFVLIVLVEGNTDFANFSHARNNSYFWIFALTQNTTNDDDVSIIFILGER